MYVKEMHIEVNQSSQKIAANKTRKLFSEEIDWLLNKNLFRFIQSYVTPKEDGSGGFELKQFGADALRTLIVNNHRVPAYKTTGTLFKSILPGNYSYLLADSSSVKRACYGTVTESAVTEHLLVLPVRMSTKAEAPFYTTANITLNGTQVFNITSIGVDNNASYNGYNSKEQVFEVVDAMLHHLRTKNYEVYWESYGTRYYPKSIIVVASTVQTGSVTIDMVTTNGTAYTNSVIKEDISTADGKDIANGLTPSHLIPDLNRTAYFKTSPDIPITELAGDSLHIYTDKTFIVTNTLLTYVRKPRRISLILGSDCELAPDFHQAVCDLTVEYIKAMISDPSWEVKLRDNMNRTP